MSNIYVRFQDKVHPEKDFGTWYRLIRRNTRECGDDAVLVYTSSRGIETLASPTRIVKDGVSCLWLRTELNEDEAWALIAAHELTK